MPWSRYPKIAESSAAAPASVTTGQWLCTEKIHGANFSVMATAEGDVHFASRSGTLAEDDNFFGYRSQGLDAYLRPRALALRQALLQSGASDDGAAVTVYGELYGGEYPHPEVQVASGGVGPVQRGVWYSPSLSFMGFDVAISDGTGARYLSFDSARDAAKEAGFCFVAPVFRGTLAECLDCNVRFASTVPATHGLPPLVDVPNWAEGLVVRPATEPREASARGLIKRKIPEFSERQYANDAWRGARHGETTHAGGGGMSWAVKEELLRYEMLAAINQQRLDSVASKIGRVDPTNKVACRRLLDDFMLDVAEALVDDGLLTQADEMITAHVQLHRECESACRPFVARFLRAGQPDAEAELDVTLR